MLPADRVTWPPEVVNAFYRNAVSPGAAPKIHVDVSRASAHALGRMLYFIASREEPMHGYPDSCVSVDHCSYSVDTAVNWSAFAREPYSTARPIVAGLLTCMPTLRTSLWEAYKLTCAEFGVFVDDDRPSHVSSEASETMLACDTDLADAPPPSDSSLKALAKPRTTTIIKAIATVVGMCAFTGFEILRRMIASDAPASQMLIGLGFTYYTVPVYFVASWLVMHDRMWPALAHLWRLRVTGLVGFLTAAAYSISFVVVFPFASAGEVVFSGQTQAVVVWALSVFWFKLRLPWWKHVCVLLVAAAVMCSLPSAMNPFWSIYKGSRRTAMDILLTVNTLTAASIVCVEGLSAYYWRELDDTVSDDERFIPLLPRHRQPHTLPDTDSLFSRSRILRVNKLEFVLLLNMMVGVWSAVFWLGFVWVPMVTYDTQHVWFFKFSDTTLPHYLLLTLCQLVGAVCAATLAVSESAMFAQIVTQSGQVVVSQLLAQAWMHQYRIPTTDTMTALTAIASTAAVVYACQSDQPFKDETRVRTAYARLLHPCVRQ